MVMVYVESICTIKYNKNDIRNLKLKYVMLHDRIKIYSNNKLARWFTISTQLLATQKKGLKPY